jgi:hypothetical protein
MEHDKLVDAVEKLRLEMVAHSREDLLFHGLVRFVGRGNPLRTKVRGHDHNGVLEIDRPSVPVG